MRKNITALLTTSLILSARAITCWSRNTYTSDSDTGYAVITTYKDINGTVLFLIWGHWCRDTSTHADGLTIKSSRYNT